MPVALIESEKTVIICSGLMHQYLQLAKYPPQFGITVSPILQ